MRPYVCVSFDPADRERAESFIREMTRYGFRCEVPDPSAPRRKRESVMAAADCVYGIVLTSTAAEPGACAADIRFLLNAGKAVMCASVEKNSLDLRLSVEPDFENPAPAGLAERIRLPDAAADAGEQAMFVHRFYVCRLSRLSGCFSPSRCVDDRTGRVIRLAAAARGGDASSALSLARLYEAGVDLPRLESEAARWLETAAAGRIPDAMLRLAEYRLDGIGGPRDPETALSLYRAVQAMGDTRGLYGEGVCAQYGLGMLRDKSEAARLFGLSADAGYAPARYRLGLLKAEADSSTDEGFFSAAWDLYRAAAALTGYREPTRRVDAPPMPDPRTVTPLFSRRPAALMRRTKPTLRAVTLRHMAETVLAPAVEKRYHRVPTARMLFNRSTYRRVDCPEAAWTRVPADPETDAALVQHDSHFTAWRYDPAMAAFALGILLEKRHQETAFRRSPAGKTGEKTAPTAQASDVYVIAGDGSRIYMPSAGTRPSGMEAVRWYRIALQNGHSAAAGRLGDCYRRGVGVPRDPLMAAALYEYAARAGSRDAQFALAVCFETGDGVPRDGERAVTWYERAAAAGSPEAMNNLGGCCERGFGTAADPAAAVEWYVRAAKRGQPEAACRLGFCYETGRVTNRDPVRAADLYRLAAEKGNAAAVYRLGLFYDRGIAVEPSFSVSARLYAQAAQAGVADACYAVGLCAKAGRGVMRDINEAFRWFRAGMGEAGQTVNASLRCAWEAGCCLLEGQGTVRDRAAAVECFRRAAALWAEKTASGRTEDVGIPCDGLSERDAAANALYMLGCCALCGIGTDAPAGVDEVSGLLKQAAASGHAGACALLGDLYTYGLMTVPAAAASAPGGTSRVPMPSPAGLHVVPWSGISEAAREEAVRWYGQAAAASVKAGELSRRGRADALTALAAERYAAADALYAAGKPAEAVRADGEGWQLLCRAYTEAPEARDEAAYLMAAAVYGGRYPAAGTDDAQERETVVSGLLDSIGTESALYAAAGLVLGDRALYRIQTESGGEPRTEAYRAVTALYARALSEPVPDEESDEMPWDEYRLPARRAGERRRTEQVRAQTLYRMAILTSTHLRGEEVQLPDGRTESAGSSVCYAFLCQAVLMGNEQAREDLARMVSLHQAEAASRQTDAHETRRALRRRSRTGFPADMSPAAWLTDYYTADRRAAVPFASGTQYPDAVDAADADVRSADPSLVPVTPAMRAEAMNFLGDCLYFGSFLPMDRVSAVTCFRSAATVRLGRGDPPCEAIAWAQYSLGDCLINGIGCPADPREGVSWLTQAAKTHGKAAYTLARCFEAGIGVDPGDYRLREAVKYYRKAEALGYRYED